MNIFAKILNEQLLKDEKDKEELTEFANKVSDVIAEKEENE